MPGLRRGQLPMLIASYGKQFVTHFEGNVGQLNTSPCTGLHRIPMLVDVKRICVAVADEVLHDDVLHIPTASVRLYHHHLVRLVGVYVLVHHVRYIDIDSKRAECRAAAPITVYILNKDVMSRTLVIMLA
jgi:hypothetical protein